MISLREAFINKKNLHKVNPVINWPNPFDLTEKYAIMHLEDWPLEVITLALLEAKLIRSKSYTVKNLQDSGIDCAFAWFKSKDGLEFWDNMRHKNFDDFYKVYTPAKLKERLENEIT